MTAAEATAEGFRPITSAYSVRQFEQCEMLDHVIADFDRSTIRLVRNAAGNKITVWRK